MHFISGSYLLLATVLPLTTTFALPTTISTEEVSNLHFKGVFSHEGEEFELYSPDAASTSKEAYAAYVKSVTEDAITDNANENTTLTYEEAQFLLPRDTNQMPHFFEASAQGDHTSSDNLLSKRNYKSPYGYDPQRFPHYQWINCTRMKDHDSIAGCNRNRKTAPNQYYNARGFLQTKRDLVEMWDKAFEGGNGNKRPRSICRQAGDKNQYTLCVSWAFGVDAAPTKWQLLEMIEYAMECQGTRGMLSSQYNTKIMFPTTTKSTKILYAIRMLCISGRANGCTRAEWFCKDLFYAGDDYDRNHPVFNDQRIGMPAARGPCVKNCEELRGQDPVPANATVIVPPIPYSNVWAYDQVPPTASLTA